MEHKNKSFSRIKRHQSDKVLRYSIRKYSFGAASVAVAALMFLGTHAVSADVVDAKNQPTIGAPNPNEEESPQIEPAPISKNEETKETEKVEVAKKTEKIEEPAENQEALEANPLTNGTSTSAITVTEDASGDKVAEKQTLDKTKLQANITKVQELLDKVNKEKAPASTLAAIQADLENAKNALNNNELTQAEVDAAAKTLSDKLFILSSMPKLGTPKKVSDETVVTPKTETEIKHSLETVKEDLQKYVKKSEITTDKPNVTAAEEILENISKQLENTTLTSKELTTLLEQAKAVRNTLVNEELRANSGARDSRNNRSMGEGVNFRADGVNVEGALYNVKEYISEDKFTGGGTVTGARARTIDKTFMTAKYSTEGNKKFITYDVYFQNDGQALSGYNGNAFWFYPPRDLLYQGGSYPVGVVSDLYYERYQKNTGATGTLSHNSNNFTRVGERYTVPLGRLASNSYQDSDSQRLWGSAGGLFQMSGGPTSVNSSQLQQMLKGLKDNPELNRIVRQDNGQLPRASYSHLLTVGSHQDYAYKFHIKVRLRDDVTAEQAQKAGTIAVTAKEGKAFNALQAYIYSATGTRLETKPDAQIDPIQGLTVTKTVGDTLGDPNDPANSGYVRHKENKSFPGGMTWSWQGGVKPTSTAKAGVFKYKVIATYQDGTTSEDKGSGSDGTVTLIVRPTAPTITTAPQYNGTLVSTDRVISGTGTAGATIKVTLQDGTTGTTTVNNQGKWTYNLGANEKLTQNTKSDATIKADNAISVTQTQNGAESEASTVNVQLAKAISIDTPVQAGRELTVKVPHDAGQFYIQLNYGTRQEYEYGVKQVNGQWQITDPNKANTTELIVKNGANISEKELTLRIKDSNKKINIPFTIPAGENKIRVRVHHVNAKNNPANPANETDQGWITASPATNNAPTITVKAPSTRNYTADGSLTLTGLKNLVTVADKEDDANKTVGNTASDNFNLTIRKGNQVVNLKNNDYLKKGEYTLTYATTDAAGATVTKEHTITVSSLAESKGTSITYPV
ncbi:YSIRK-type signal peptide-containing protein, partial [Streptococcus mitis]